MRSFYVFNGDADGIFALVQLKLAERGFTRQAKLVTGVKRDINLLAKIDAGAGDFVTVLDISMRTNKRELMRILSDGAEVLYIDHHNTGDVPISNNLITIIDTYPSLCTSLLVDYCLEHKFHDWAIAAAFGDNLAVRATALADKAGYSSGEIKMLKQLGELVNYNAYGQSIADLHFSPKYILTACARYKSAFGFIKSRTDIIEKLQQGLNDDLAKAKQAKQIAPDIYLFDNEKWARRIYGIFANHIVSKNPTSALAILTKKDAAKAGAGYTVSIRAPLKSSKTKHYGADRLALKFPTGGGRVQSAGINHLPDDMLDEFITAFAKNFPPS